MRWLKIARHFKTQGIQKTIWKGAKKATSYDSRSFNLIHTFFGDPSIYKKNYEFLKLKFR